MGELQINMILEKIKSSAKIQAETRVPRVAYRETLRMHLFEGARRAGILCLHGTV